MSHTNRVFLYGASGHAKVICEILEARHRTPGGLIDDNPLVTSLLEYPVYHNLQEVVLTTDDHFIISIGNNRIRKAVAAKLNAVKFTSAIHPAAVISPRSSVGEGTVVMANVTVNAQSNIGNHVILNTNCSIDHDCIVEDFVHISPNVALAGNVQVGEGTHIGIGACVLQNIRIGKWVTIGAGAVIIRDVPDYAVVVGNPGRVIKTNKP
ncbi:acetyltransferase [Niastella caeni]|uniref:Acetyltransferase n=1 Tax=Niastella caeni TaxID=2569763 RepID=A0A4S8HGF2_9BACT|nr:acetyltransferase [Niastella caeni]THU34097.1 acetyltransferase [Niastella caeni]